MNRSKFKHKVYNSQGGCYGVTTDIYKLPVGTKFHVVNGAWDGEIVEKDKLKYMHIIETDKFVELKPDVDYELVID
jgi:hypothetical protein